MSSELPIPNAPAAFSRIMVGVDPTRASAPAVRYLRRLLHPGAAVRVVCIAEDPRTLVPIGKWAGLRLEAARDELRRDAENAIEDAQRVLEGCAARIDGHLVDLCTHGGDRVHALAEAASHWRADLVVLGTRQHRGLERWIEGEVSAPLARLLHWPALIVPGDYAASEDETPSRILFATDGSEASHAALRAAIRLAAPRAHWRVIFVVDRLLAPGTGPFNAHFEDLLAETGRAAIEVASAILAAQRQQGWTVETALVRTRHSHDDVAHAIVGDARNWQAQLVVLGTHGRRGLTRWMLGSVAERTVRSATCPLLLAPAILDAQDHAASASA